MLGLHALGDVVANPLEEDRATALVVDDLDLAAHPDGIAGPRHEPVPELNGSPNIRKRENSTFQRDRSSGEGPRTRAPGC